MTQCGSSMYGVGPFDGLLPTALHSNESREPKEDLDQVLIDGIDGKPAGWRRQEGVELVRCESVACQSIPFPSYLDESERSTRKRDGEQVHRG